MMKLNDFAMALANADQPVILIDKKSRRITFEGTAYDLLDYSGIDYRKVSGIVVKDNILYIEIK